MLLLRFFLLQVPSCKTRNTQETAYGFPTLCPTMFLTWCRVVVRTQSKLLFSILLIFFFHANEDFICMQHEENLEILNKLVSDVLMVVCLLVCMSFAFNLCIIFMWIGVYIDYKLCKPTSCHQFFFSHSGQGSYFEV